MNMLRVIVGYVLFALLIFYKGHAQTSLPAGASTYTYHHASQDKDCWQRLNIWLSATFLNVVKEGQLDLDSALHISSRSLGLSLYSIVAEGINYPDLQKHSTWLDRRQPHEGVRLLAQATGKKRLPLLVLLGSYYAFQNDSYHRYKDSVEFFLTKAIREGNALAEGKLARQALCVLGKMYIHANDSKGDSIYSVLLSQCQKAGDKETEARAIAYRGIYTLPSPESFQAKITDLRKAASLYHNLLNTEAEINVLVDLGYMLSIAGQLKDAEEAFLQSLRLANSIVYPYVHYITGALLSITNFQRKFGESLRYTLQSIKVAETCRDTIALGYLYNSLASLFESEGRDDESREFSRKAQDRFVIDRNPAIFNELVDTVSALGVAGRAREAMDLTLDIATKVNAPTTLSDQFYYHRIFAICYINLYQQDAAILHIEKMDSLETLAEKIRGPLKRSLIDDLYAIIYFQQGQYRKARATFEKHFTQSSWGTHTVGDDLIAYSWLLKIDSLLGDSKAEIEHYKKYTQLLDSSFHVTKLRQAEELQVLYQIEEKETEIATLTRQAELEKKNAEQASVVKKLAIAGIVAALIIAGLLFRQNRLRKRTNQVIVANNKEIILKNEQLERLLADKEWLLKEIHHRVKNNLQIVMSLLSSQSAYINNEEALAAIHDSRHRLHAIALIHQKLYQAENISQIDMPVYIDELVSYLHESFDTGNRIVFRQSVDPVNLDVSQAIPLGLIINECIINAIKYAFPGNRQGLVSVGLHYDDSDHLLLSIVDNGIGLPPSFDMIEHDSLGLDLMKGLSKQIKGTLEVSSSQGVRIALRFPILKT